MPTVLTAKDGASSRPTAKTPVTVTPEDGATSCPELFRLQNWYCCRPAVPAGNDHRA